MWTLLSLACTPDPRLEGTCERDEDNALRAHCTFDVDPPMEISLSLSSDGTDNRTHSSDTASAAHSFSLLRMRPETRYTWTAFAGETELTGVFETGTPPDGAALAVTRTGAPPSGDTMFVASCDGAYAVALDPDGGLVWYQDLAAGLPGDNHSSISLTLTEDHTILAILDRGILREFTLEGELVAEMRYGDGVDQVLHHDAFRRNGRTWALTARRENHNGTDYIVDGLAAFDADGNLFADGAFSQFATPSGAGGPGAIYWTNLWPGVIDWAHANGLYVDSDGDVLVSLHTFSTILRVEGEPGAPGFGSIVWALGGSADSPFGSDFVIADPDGLTDDETFEHQHHPSLLSDGSLQLFDNGETVADEARILRLSLDVNAGVADIAGSWPIGQICPVEGSAFVRPDGNLVASCSVRTTFYEIDADDGAITGTTEAICPGNTGLDVIPRAIPIDLIAEQAAR